MISHRFLSALYTTGVALTAFSAIYWPKFLGPLAASPGVLLITACTFLYPLVRVRRSQVAKRLGIPLLMSIGVLGSFLSIALFGWSSFYMAKSLSLALLSLVWISPLLMQDVLLMRHISTAAFAGLVICLAGYLLSDLMNALPQAIRDVLFSEKWSYYQESRARGFTEEPGHFATLFGRFLFIVYLIWESRRAYSAVRLVSMLCFTAATLVVLGSKGAAVSIAFAILFVSVRWKQLPYLVILFPVIAWLASTQISYISWDIEKFTSFATRLTLASAAICGALLNPFGYGFYGFYATIQFFGSRAIDWFSGYQLIFSEVQEIVYEFVNVSTKSTILDFVLVLGWPFLFVLWRVVAMINIRDSRALACLIYFLLTAMATSANLSITFFLGLIVLIKKFPAASPGLPLHDRCNKTLN